MCGCSAESAVHNKQGHILFFCCNTEQQKINYANMVSFFRTHISGRATVAVWWKKIGQKCMVADTQET